MDFCLGSIARWDFTDYAVCMVPFPEPLRFYKRICPGLEQPIFVPEYAVDQILVSFWHDHITAPFLARSFFWAADREQLVVCIFEAGIAGGRCRNDPSPLQLKEKIEIQQCASSFDQNIPRQLTIYCSSRRLSRLPLCC